MGVYFADGKGHVLDIPRRITRLYEIKHFSLREFLPSTPLDEPSIRLMRRMFINNPYDLWLGLMVGNSLYHERQYGQALEAYLDAAEVEPRFAPAAFNCALCHYRLGSYAEAADWCRTAIAAAPGLADTHYLMGLIHSQQADPEAEKQAYRTALSINPSHGSALVNLAECLLLEGDCAEAMRLADEGSRLDLHPHDQVLCLFLGFLGSAVASSRSWATRLRKVRSANRNLARRAKLGFDFGACLKLASSQLTGRQRREATSLIRSLQSRDARPGAT
jgi:tetratricopeptide (TPR) repeat protein